MHYTTSPTVVGALLAGGSGVVVGLVFVIRLIIRRAHL